MKGGASGFHRRATSRRTCRRGQLDRGAADTVNSTGRGDEVCGGEGRVTEVATSAPVDTAGKRWRKRVGASMQWQDRAAAVSNRTQSLWWWLISPAKRNYAGDDEGRKGEGGDQWLCAMNAKRGVSRCQLLLELDTRAAACRCTCGRWNKGGGHR